MKISACFNQPLPKSVPYAAAWLRTLISCVTCAKHRNLHLCCPISSGYTTQAVELKLLLSLMYHSLWSMFLGAVGRPVFYWRQIIWLTNALSRTYWRNSFSFSLGDRHKEYYTFCCAFCVAWWRCGSTLDSWLDGPGFESRSRHLSHCVIPLSREFTHSCSRSTQPSHPSVGWQKWRAALCCSNNWHVPSVH